jgi:tRNA-intron endonuclease
LSQAEEVVTQLHGRLKGGGIIIGDVAERNDLESRGFGEKDEATEKFLLNLTEGLYLVYAKRLIIRGWERASFEDLVSYALKKDKNAWTRFLIYRDLRTRGYVAKDGFGFGVDFRVYERGEYGIKPARFVVFGLNEGSEMVLGEFVRDVEQMARMGKESVMAVVERRGEVIYYKTSKWRPLNPHAELCRFRRVLREAVSCPLNTVSRDVTIKV